MVGVSFTPRDNETPAVPCLLTELPALECFIFEKLTIQTNLRFHWLESGVILLLMKWIMEGKVWDMTVTCCVNIVLKWWVFTFLTTVISWHVKISVLVFDIVHVLINRGRRRRRNSSSSTGGRASDGDSRPESGGGRYLTPNNRAHL